MLGTARLRLALVIAALAATTLTLLTSLPAYAEPTPKPDPTSSPTASPSAPPAGPAPDRQRTPTPEELEAIEDVMREQSEHVSKAAQKEMLRQHKERLRKLLPDEGGVLGVFNVTDKNGLPISAYTVGSDTGGTLDWDLGVQNLITELNFMITKWLIAFACWLIAWSLSFGLAKLLLTPVLSVANSLHARVIMEMGLPSLFLAVCALICTARIFFGDRAKGWGDAAVSLVLAALTTTLLASTPQTLMGEQDGALSMARGLSLEVADVILDANPADPTSDKPTDDKASSSALARPLTDALTDAFVVKPAMLLQYGRVFEGKCAADYSDTKISQLAFDRQVTSRMNKLKKISGLADYIDPTGGISSYSNASIDMATRWAVEHFGGAPMEAFEKRCVPGDVDAAKQASLDKVGGSIFLLLAAAIVTVMITGLAGGFLVAQCRIAWDAIRGEPALVVGTIPGFGRAYLWDWAASVLRSLAQMLTSVIALAIFIVVVQAILDPVQQDWGRELTLRFLCIDLVCIAAVMKRKMLSARAKQLGSSWRAKMSSNRIGGTHGSAFTAPASEPVTKRPRIARATARGLVRSGMIGVSLAQGNPLAAIGYAMPATVGATALMSRINHGGRNGYPRPAARQSRPSLPPPSAQPGTPEQEHPPAQPEQATPSSSDEAGPTIPPRPTHPPQPSSPAPPPRPNYRPGARPARRTSAPSPVHGAPGARAVAGQRATQRHSLRTPSPAQPAASARQQQLRQRLARGGPRRTQRRDSS
ncbi:hypothetical protein [Streptomyces sp. bgisy100]|uniref:hypothetical protein n=1 Tax=Streptomyces sp. bgisy100 TaxID=3413783 RepID=UPI003D730DF7